MKVTTNTHSNSKDNTQTQTRSSITGFSLQLLVFFTYKFLIFRGPSLDVIITNLHIFLSLSLLFLLVTG